MLLTQTEILLVPSCSHQAADPTLSLIASVLASKPQLAVLSAGSAGSGTVSTPRASRRSQSSHGLELRTDAKLWEVQWSELSIVRPIGKGEQCCFGMHSQALATC